MTKPTTHHAHSHPRRKGPRVYSEAELHSRARRLERRAERDAAGRPAEVVVQVAQHVPGYQPAGQRSGQLRSNPYALPWYVREALNRQAAEAVAERVR